MQLPSIVKQIGNIAGENRVYIEDYVYTYLNEIRAEKNCLPVRVALFGHACSKEQKCFYFIYGASCVIEELENGRNEEQVREQFFESYSLLGYVNIYNEKKELIDKKGGYYIFYESNEAMQNYLISRYERKNTGLIQEKETKQELGERKKAMEEKPAFWEGLLQKLLYGFFIAIAAIAVVTIDDYNKMYDFTETAVQAVRASEEMR